MKAFGRSKAFARIALLGITLLTLTGCGSLLDSLIHDTASPSEELGAEGRASYSRSAKATSPSATMLLDSNEDQERFMAQRRDSYARKAPRAEGGIRVSVMYAGFSQPGSLCGEKMATCGAVGVARSESGETVEVDSRDHTRSVVGEDVSYEPDEEISQAPPDQRYGGSHQQVRNLFQNFYFDENGHHTLELTQVGTAPRDIAITFYDGNGDREAATFFSVGHRLARPGTRMKLELEPGASLDELRLREDLRGDGNYEQNWAPEASIFGSRTNDHQGPVTTTSIGYDPNSSAKPLLILEPEDYSESPSPSGTGITYFYHLKSSPWILDSIPRVYTGPTPIESGSVIVFWSTDRAGNGEWRDVIEVP